MGSATGVGAAAVRSLANELESMSLVECRELHGRDEFGTHYDEDIKKITYALERCTDIAPQIAAVAHSGGWLRSSDTPLDLALHYTGGLYTSTRSKLMNHHGRRRKPCLLCEDTDTVDFVLDQFFQCTRMLYI